MRRIRSTWNHTGSVLLASVLMMAASCTGDAGGSGSGIGINSKTAAALAEIGKLLPENTAAVVQIESIDSLNEHANDLAKASGQDEGGDLRDMLRMLPGRMLGDGQWIDTAKPIVLAITSKRATPPGVTAMIPTTNSVEYCKSLGATSKAYGDYVVVSLAGKYEPQSKPCTLLEDLVPGCISISGDVASFAKNYKVLIDSALDFASKQILAQTPESNDGIDMETVIALYMDLARTVLDSAETLDAGISYREGKLDVEMQLQARPDSSMAGWSQPPVDPTPLGAGIRGDASMEMLFLGDMTALGPHYDTMMSRLLEIYPAEMQSALQQMLETYKDIYGAMGPGMAMEGDVFTPNGMQLTAIMNPTNPETLTSKFLEVLGGKSAQTMGFAAQDVQRGESSASKTLDFKLAIDAEKMSSWVSSFNGQTAGAAVLQENLLPKNPIPVRTAWNKDRLAMSMGDAVKNSADDVLAASSGSWSADMQGALKRLDGCNPAIAYRFDYAAMMRGAFDSTPAQRMPKIPEGATANFSLFGGVQGTEWRAGMSLDLRGMIELFANMTPR